MDEPTKCYQHDAGSNQSDHLGIIMADAILSVKNCHKCGETFSGRACLACARAYKRENAERVKAKMAEWRAANADKVKQYSKDYYAENCEAVLARSKEYAAANKERIVARVAKHYAEHREEISAKAKAKRLADPERYRAREAEWRAKNPERVKATARKYYYANQEKISQDNAARRAANPDVFRERFRAWREANIDIAKALYTDWHARNRDKRRADIKEYRKLNPERIRIHKANRRARKKANGGRLSAGLVRKLYTLQKGMCACCGKSLANGYHLDHIVPLVLGGENADHNMQLLTPECNMRKGAKRPEEFMRQRGFLL